MILATTLELSLLLFFNATSYSANARVQRLSRLIFARQTRIQLLEPEPRERSALSSHCTRSRNGVPGSLTYTIRTRRGSVLRL